MPLYEFICKSCDNHFEQIVKISQVTQVSCPECGDNKVSKKTSRPSFHLKGDGWYKDGYESKSKEVKPVSTNQAKASSANEKSNPTPSAKPAKSPSPKPTAT